MNEVRRDFKFRLEPTKEHEKRLRQFAGATRWVFNNGLQQRREAFEKGLKPPTYFEQNNALVHLKKKEETRWLADVHSQVLQQSLKDLDLAYAAAFRRLKSGSKKPGFPKFKKRGMRDSFRFPQGVRVEDGRVYLPCIGWVDFIQSREICGTIKQTTIRLEGKHWYVSFQCEWQQVKPVAPSPDPQKVVGIDVGTKHFATLAVGLENEIQQIPNQRLLQQMLSKLRRLQRRLSKKVKYSENWKKLALQIQCLHARIRNARLDFLHKLSTELIKNHDVLCIESLDIQGMLEAAPKNLARSISDVGWGIFFRLLKYKAEEHGKYLIELDRYFPGSQICSCCGNQQKMPLSERIYNCAGCGVAQDRDVNAAINYKTTGISVLNACRAASVEER